MNNPPFNINNYYWTRLSKISWFVSGKQDNLPFSHKNDRKKEKTVVSFTHDQNIICSQTQLEDIAQEQTIIFILQVMWWALGQRKGRKICIPW